MSRDLRAIEYDWIKLCSRIFSNAIPTKLAIGERIYEILSFHRGENYVNGYLMAERAMIMNAALGREDCFHLLNNQDEIPVALRGKVIFVFTYWTDIRRFTHSFAYIYWGEELQRWILSSRLASASWGNKCRVLRLKFAFAWNI